LNRLDRLLSQTRGNQIHVGKKLKSQLQNRQQAFLGRDLDMLAFASGEARKERSQRGDSGIDSSLEAGLLAERFQRWQLVRAGSAPVQVGQSPGIPQGQVGGLG